jgi:hypothetical protein
MNTKPRPVPNTIIYRKLASSPLNKADTIGLDMMTRDYSDWALGIRESTISSSNPNAKSLIPDTLTL